MMTILCLLALDDVASLAAKLRAASDVSEQDRFETQLSRLAKPAHLPLLLREIEAAPESVRRRFVHVMRTVGGREAIQALRAIAGKYDWPCRVETALALKGLGDGTAIPGLAAEFQKPAMTSGDRMKILPYFHAYYCESQDVVPALRRVLEMDKDDQVRGTVIEILMTHRDAGVAPALWRIWENPSDPVRYGALGALLRLGDARALEPSLRALEAGTVPPDGVAKILYAYRSVGRRSVAATLRSLLERCANPEQRVLLIETLGALQDREAMPLLETLADDPDGAVAVAASTSMLRMAERSDVARVRGLLTRPDPDLRMSAAEALLKLDDLSGLETLREALRSVSTTRRLRAVALLGSHPRKETVEPLLDAMADSDVQVRTAAVHGLKRTWSLLFPYARFDWARAGTDASSGDPAARDEDLRTLRAWWLSHAPK